MIQMIQNLLFRLTTLFILLSISACYTNYTNAIDSSQDLSQNRSEINLTKSQKQKIGRKIWIHECGGTVDGLTSWNAGENFASLGIGHFIWFPKNVNPPFEESFPSLIRFMKNNGVNVPSWLLAEKYCPWDTKREFYINFNSDRMFSLRNFLKNTIDQQTDFIILRLKKSLMKMERSLNNYEDINLLRKRFYEMLSSPEGTYAMIDYVNFKGEGVNIRERYNGLGWGLLQVLLNMENYNHGLNSKSAVNSFSNSAQFILKRRIKNAPRNETKWMNGWLKRCKSYKNTF